MEDNADFVELLCFNLKAAGFQVVTAESGIEGLKKARSLRPDLILIDLMLPELDGFALCDVLREEAATALTPIFILTAMSSQLSRFAGLDAGANAYFIKPFNMKTLIMRVEETLTGAATRARSRQARI